jgi:hypothetical protein
MPVFLDEFAYYFGCHNDSLKEVLRKIDGVPNVTYLVKDGHVFVFDKLVQLVEEHRNVQPDLPLADLARSLIAEAILFRMSLMNGCRSGCRSGLAALTRLESRGCELCLRTS